MVVPREVRAEILKAYHDSLASAHLGYAKNFDKIRRKYYWPKLEDDIDHYIEKCDE